MGAGEVGDPAARALLASRRSANAARPYAADPKPGLAIASQWLAKCLAVACQDAPDRRPVSRLMADRRARLAGLVAALLGLASRTILIESGLLGPRVLDLLEHLAHARTHEVPRPGGSVAVAAPDPLGLARVEIVLRIHAPNRPRHAAGASTPTRRDEPGVSTPARRDEPGVTNPAPSTGALARAILRRCRH